MLALLAQTADDIDVAQNVGFYVIAALMVLAALRVVTLSVLSMILTYGIGRLVGANI